ncbi:MAG: paraquat-inducible protein A [Nautiliaceae bacterium]
MKNIIICPKCKTLNKKIPLNPAEVAVCNKCGYFLYRNVPFLKYKLFSFSLSALIFFLIANIFPIIHINILGYEGKFTLINGIVYLYSEGYLFLAFFTLLSVVIFPLLILLGIFLFSNFLIFNNKKLAKETLVFLTVLRPWVYVDIFFVAILVTLVKVLNYGDISFDIGFISIVFYLLFEIYFFKYIKLQTLWEYIDV